MTSIFVCLNIWLNQKEKRCKPNLFERYEFFFMGYIYQYRHHHQIVFSDAERESSATYSNNDEMYPEAEIHMSPKKIRSRVELLGKRCRDTEKGVN